MMKDKCWKWGLRLSLPFLGTLLSSPLRRRHFLFAKDSLFHLPSSTRWMSHNAIGLVKATPMSSLFYGVKMKKSIKVNVATFLFFQTLSIDRRCSWFFNFQLCNFKKKSGPQLAWFEAGRGRSRGGKTRQFGKPAPVIWQTVILKV